MFTVSEYFSLKLKILIPFKKCIRELLINQEDTVDKQNESEKEFFSENQHPESEDSSTFGY